MNNHITYFYDQYGELEITRCCLCKQMYISSVTLMCRHGYDCERKECIEREPIDKKDITKVLMLLRKERRESRELRVTEYV